MTILSKLLDRVQGPANYIVVINDGEAYAIHKNRKISTDVAASKPSLFARARKLARAINRELDLKNAN